MGNPDDTSNADITADDLLDDSMTDGLNMDDLEFDQDLQEEDDFTDDEDKPRAQRAAQATSPEPQATAEPPNNAKRNTLILFGVTVGLVLLAGLWVFLSSGPAPQRTVPNADDLLPPVDQMQAQQSNQSSNNQDPAYGQQAFPQGQTGYNQGVQYNATVKPQPSQPATTNRQSSVVNYNATGMQQGYNPVPKHIVAYDENGNPHIIPAQGQHGGMQPHQNHAIQPTGLQGQQPVITNTGMITDQTSGQATLSHAGSPEHARPEKDPVPDSSKIPDQMVQLLEKINQLTQGQQDLVKEIRKSTQVKPVDNGKISRLTLELETTRTEMKKATDLNDEHLATIEQLKAKVKDLTGKNTFLRQEERKWRYKVKDLEEKLAFSPQLKAKLHEFNGKWELRGLDPDKAVFISHRGAMQEVKVGDQIDGLTIKAIYFAKRQVETNAGTILYQ